MLSPRRLESVRCDPAEEVASVIGCSIAFGLLLSLVDLSSPPTKGLGAYHSMAVDGSFASDCLSYTSLRTPLIRPIVPPNDAHHDPLERRPKHTSLSGAAMIKVVMGTMSMKKR